MNIRTKCVFAIVFIAFLCSVSVWGQSVPTGFQDYLVLGNEEHVWRFFNAIRTGEGGPASFPQAAMASVVGASASADGQVVYYDQWEDGFEANPLSPVQATTLILGDGNSVNGDANTYTNDPRVTSDVILAGTNLVLNSDQAAGPTLQQVIPMSPGRNSSDIRFDGGDRIYSTGGPLTVIHYQHPATVEVIGGSTEILSLQAVADASSYSVPVGTNTFTRYGGSGTAGEPFKYVWLDIAAFQDSTEITIDNKGGSVVTVTLNKGQHYSSEGRIDSVASSPITILEGTKISANKPIAAVLVGGGVSHSSGAYTSNTFTLLPDRLFGTDFVLAGPGDNPAAGTSANRPANVYVYNPNPNAAITVTATDSVGTTTFTVPANQSKAYTEASAMNRPLPSNSTARLTSASPFWGLVVHDYLTNYSDWGYSFLAKRFLVKEYTSTWSPGTSDPAGAYAVRGSRTPICNGVNLTCDSLNRSPLFVAATQDNTRVQIDLNGDGTADAVDTDSNDVANAAPLADNTYLVNAGEVLRVFDQTDYDNQGTRIIANKEVIVAYGQDTDQGTGNDETLDLGNLLYPGNSSWLNEVLTIDKTGNPTSLPSAGGNVVFTLTVKSYAAAPLSSLTISDTLPAGMSYVSGTTVITYPGGIQSFDNPGITGQRLDFILTNTNMGANETVTIQFTANLPGAQPNGLYRNRASSGATLGFGSTFKPSTYFDIVKTDVTMSKSVSTPTAAPGQNLTYTINVANNGSAQTNVVVTDPLPFGATFTGSISSLNGLFTGSFDASQNAVVWTAASFASSATDTLSFVATVLPTAPAGTVINNKSIFESTQTPAFESAGAITTVLGPELVFSKTGPSVAAPGDRLIFTISVSNAGGGAATNLLVIDPFPANTAYVPSSMEYRLGSGVWLPLTDATSGDDQGYAYANRAEFHLASLAAGAQVAFRFRVDVSASLTPPSSVTNQANVSCTQVEPKDTNAVFVSILSNTLITPPPIVSAPIIAGATSVTGTSTSPDGTVIKVYLNGVFIGQTTVTGGAWTLNSIGPLVAGQTVTATAQEAGKSVSNLSAPVIVSPIGQVTPAPVVNPAWAGDTQITGTSSSPDGALIDVFANGVYIGQTTVSGGIWILGPVTPLVAGQILTARATEPGKGTSPLSAPVTVQARPAILKRSSALGGPVTPGSRLTYTIQIANGTGSEWNNIEVSDTVPAGTTYVAASTQITAPVDQTYYDQFPALAYNGTNGTINWSSSPWFEINEADGVAAGSVQVTLDTGVTPNTNALRIAQPSGRGAYRAADLSTSSAATLSYDYRRENTSSSANLSIDISSDGGANWSTVATISGTTANDATYQASGNITIPSAYLRAGFRVRFLRTGTSTSTTRFYHIDNVRISTRIRTTAAGCAPAMLVGAVGCNGYSLLSGETMTVTFQVDVADCITGSIANTASLTANAASQGSSTVTDNLASRDFDGDGILDTLDGCVDSDGDGISNYKDLDSDNDGILDSVEMRIDTDGDTVYDYLDLDTDNDGINDIVESGLNATELAALDTNGDGRVDIGNAFGTNGLANALEAGAADSGNPDYDNNNTGPDAVANTDGTGPADFRDLDSDNDGINDVIEGAETDADGNGMIDGVPNGVTGQLPGADNTTPNTDGTGLPDYRDLDSDGDSINDIVESGQGYLDGNNDGVIDSATDTDNDGIPDVADGADAVFGDAIDSDNDGIPNSTDIDDDNDGILDTVEGSGAVDTDGDGVTDSLDLDSDNDGINDLLESGLNTIELNVMDANGDGRIDFTVAVGTNGLANIIEAGAVDSGNPDYDNDNSGPDAVANTDGTGPADFRDLDSDNDGVNDVVEGAETDADGNGLIDGTPDPVTGQIPGADNAAPNTDGTGLPDYRDLDSDGDSINDIVESGQGYLDGNNDGAIDTTTDTDNDGIPNVADGLPAAFGDARDSDNDGVSDAIDIDDDNDGILDTVEGPPGTDTDGDSVPDSLDLDSDNDGINDLVESGLNFAELAVLDANGDGRIDFTVAVGTNGLADLIEAGPADSGNPDYDNNNAGPDAVANTDGSGPADFRDLDSDNDGINDVTEGGETDADGNGFIDGTPDPVSGQIPGADDVVPDTDGTGLPDYRDLDSDGDSINDIVESGQGYLDGDNNGVIDSTTDTDNDGIPNVSDGLPAVFGDARDTDNDGVPDGTDIDDDNDGILDTVEGPPGTDTDGDGVPDAFDLDSDNDGINDLVESGLNLTEISLLDANGDGRIDLTAAVGANGLADMIEAGAADSGNPDYDNNNAGPDAVANTDGSGPADFRDLDSDNDGINDVLEGGGTDANIDGLIDGTPDPLTGKIPGADNAVPDADNDGTGDYRDLDSDNDGIKDNIESGKSALDLNSDGRIDDTTDSDGDGLPDVSDGNTGVWKDAPTKPNLLRNDDVTSLATYNPSAIFTKTYPLAPGDTSLQGYGANGRPDEWEGGQTQNPGSGDDDDHYISKVFTTTIDGADNTVLSDSSRPLVFYELSCSSCVIKLSKTAGRIAITW